jgi:hypothetical protein
MRDAKAQDKTFAPFDYDLKDKPFNIEKIRCNSGTSAAVYLLAIEEKIACNHINDCVCNKNKGNTTDCIADPKLFTHVYVNSEDKKASIKHFFVEFVKRRDMENYKKLIDDILLNTINCFKIKNERLRFHIFYDIDKNNLSPLNNITSVKDNISNYLKGKIPECKEDEFACTAGSIIKDAEMLVFSSDSPTIPYKFEVS